METLYRMRDSLVHRPSSLRRRAENPGAVAFASANTQESALAKFAIGGVLTILLEACGGHLMEFLKITKQTSSDSYLTLIRNITRTKGFAGTLDGFLPWGLIQAVAKGSVFSFGSSASLNALDQYTSMTREQKIIASGGIGGFVQGIVLSPILLLKTRVMTDPAFRTSGGFLETAAASLKIGSRLVSSEGPAALMKGADIFSLKRAADWTTRYLFVVLVEEAMKVHPDEKLSETQKAVASLLGGTISALSTIPLDVVVATSQSAAKAGTKVSVLQTFQEQVAKNGVGGLIAFSTRGLLARIVHVATTTYVMKTVTTQVYDVLYR